MSRTAFERIKAGLLDAIDYVEGRRRKGFRVWEIPPAEIRAARKRLALSQTQFADRFGFSVKNLQKWEQGVCQPSGAARAFLQVIAREPRAVTRALGMARLERRAAPKAAKAARNATRRPTKTW
jgi:putative transcriptional regulator